MSTTSVTSPPLLTPRQFTTALVLACLCWALMSWFSNANLDGQNDMLENYAWSHTMAWGTHKHPPFFAWVVDVWFEVFPESDLLYRLLSYANVGVGVWGVAVLGRRLGMQALAQWGALLLLWSFPYTTLAGKFNANTQLLSVWPWAAALLLASWQETGWRGWWYSTWLGLVAAACMLSKYYSGVFLAGFLLPIFLHAQGRTWLRTYRPYWALVIFFGALAPHVWWIAQHDWATLSYVQEQGDGSVHWKYVLRFFFSPAFYWLPAWLATTALYAAAHGHHTGRSAWASWPGLLWRSWMPQSKDDVLFALALMPWLLTLLFAVSGLVVLSTPWAIPIGYAFALLWLRNLHAWDPQASRLVVQRLQASWYWVLLGVLLLGAVHTAMKATEGEEDYYRPTAVAAQEIVDTWSQRHPGQRLEWVGGEWTNNALVAFYVLHGTVRTIPYMPDSWEARIEGFDHWQAQNGILICTLGTAEMAKQQQSNTCVQQSQAWLSTHGFDSTAHVLVTQRPSSWRFPHPRPFAYAIFDVPARPKQP